MSKTEGINIRAEVKYHTQTILPICARCQKPVDEMTKVEEISGAVTYIAACHGETEEITLTPADMATTINIEIGTAFTKALHGGQTEIVDTSGDGKA